jgi:hypothetical protein
LVVTGFELVYMSVCIQKNPKNCIRSGSRNFVNFCKEKSGFACLETTREPRRGKGVKGSARGSERDWSGGTHLSDHLHARGRFLGYWLPRSKERESSNQEIGKTLVTDWSPVTKKKTL